MDLYPTLEEFFRKHGQDDKQRFEARFPHPFLLVNLAETRSKAGDFATMAGSGPAEKSTEFQAAGQQATTLLVMPLAKSDRNSFHAMITLGRASNNDLVIPNGSVSKFHAFFRRDAASGRTSVFDAGSSFGTSVNGRRVDPVAGYPLASGDTLAFATVVSANFFPSGDFHDYMHLGKRREKTRTR